MGQVTAKNRAQVEDRDRGCISHGQLPGTCRGHLDIGHIVGRGMGGSDRYDTPGYLILQCRFHNLLIERDADAARTAIALGHSMRRSTADRMPGTRLLVRYPDGHWYFLNHDDPATKERMTENALPEWSNARTGL